MSAANNNPIDQTVHGPGEMEEYELMHSDEKLYVLAIMSLTLSVLGSLALIVFNLISFFSDKTVSHLQKIVFSLGILSIIGTGLWLVEFILSDYVDITVFWCTSIAFIKHICLGGEIVLTACISISRYCIMTNTSLSEHMMADRLSRLFKHYIIWSLLLPISVAITGLFLGALGPGDIGCWFREDRRTGILLVFQIVVLYIPFFAVGFIHLISLLASWKRQKVFPSPSLRRQTIHAAALVGILYLTWGWGILDLILDHIVGQIDWILIGFGLATPMYGFLNFVLYAWFERDRRSPPSVSIRSLPKQKQTSETTSTSSTSSNSDTPDPVMTTSSSSNGIADIACTTHVKL